MNHTQFENLGDDLTHHMIGGLIDRFLAYGYLGLLTQLSDDNEALYVLNTRFGMDEVRVVVSDSHVQFTYVSPDETKMRYAIEVELDIHLCVKKVDIVVTNGYKKEVAEHFHTVLRRVIINRDTLGNARRPLAVSPPIELCCAL